MAKKVLIISTSLRRGSNSEVLANAFAKGAIESGNEVEIISLKDQRIEFCRGCLVCQQTGQCVISDYAQVLTEKMKHADSIVWATPIYYYEMSGQMKTMIDRANSLYSSDYTFRDIYLLSTAAEDGDEIDIRAIQGLEGWIACFEKAHLAGTVFAGGISNAGEIKGHPALERAYAMGASIG